MPDSMFTLLLPGLPCSPPALATISWLLLTALWTSSTLAPAPSLATLWRMWARLSSSLHSAVCHHHYNNIVFIAPTCPRPPPWPRSPPPRARCRRPGCCQHLQIQLGNYKTSSVQESFKLRSTRRFLLGPSPDCEIFANLRLTFNLKP